MYPIGVGKIKFWDWPPTTLISTFGHLEVYRGCHRLLPRLKSFQTVSTCLPWKGGRALNFPTFLWKVGRSRKILRNFLSRYKILSPWITQAPRFVRRPKDPKIFFLDRRVESALFLSLRNFENARIDFVSNRGCIRRLNYTECSRNDKEKPFRKGLFSFFFFLSK